MHMKRGRATRESIVSKHRQTTTLIHQIKAHERNGRIGKLEEKLAKLVAKLNNNKKYNQMIVTLKILNFIKRVKQKCDSGVQYREKLYSKLYSLLLTRGRSVGFGLDTE